MWNSSFRGSLSQLPPERLERFGAAHLAEVGAVATKHGIRLDISAIFAMGHKSCDGRRLPLQYLVGMFRIDHPLDSANKYLFHPAVASPDMKNVYDGIETLDDHGETVVVLPTWFEALNADFRYQLTAIGAPGPNLYIAEEITNNRFRIAGGTPGMKVSWLVTGIRQDAWARVHRSAVERQKPDEERGSYLTPELHGALNGKLVQRVRYAAAREQPIVRPTVSETS